MRARFEQLAVAAAALIPFANTLANRFAVDDDFVIAGNTRVHQLADQAAIWLTPYWPAYGEQLGLYRPLAIFAYAVEWAVGGGAPWFFHLISILLHVAVALLVLTLLRRIGTGAGAFAGALVFAVHPVHTEVVANVVGQAELLAALAVMGACVLHASRPAGAALRAPRAAAIAILFALGLLAKEGAIVLPALLVAIDAVQRRTARDAGGVRAWSRAMTPAFALLATVIAGFLALRYRVLGSLAGQDAAPWLPFLREEGRIFSALRLWPEYVRLMFFPADLSADYSPAVLLPVDGVAPVVVFGALLLAGVATMAVLTPRRPGPGLAAAWFLIAVLPVSNLLFPIGVLMAERLLYLPSIGLAIGVGSLWPHVLTRVQPAPRRIAVSAGIAVIALLGVRTVVRNPDWRDSAAYYDALMRDHPESYRAQWGEAARRLSHGDRAGARQAMELARRIWPYDPQLLNELALLQIWDHAYASAVPLLERSSALNARAVQTWVNLAYAYIGARRPADAQAAAARADTLGAHRAETRALVAQSFEQRGRWSDAAAAWRESVGSPRGRTWTYWSALARALAHADRPADALAAADTARTLAPPEQRAVIDAVHEAIARGCYAQVAAVGAAAAGVGPGTGVDRAQPGVEQGAAMDRAQPVPAAPHAACADPLAEWAIVTSVNALPPDASVREAVGPAARPLQGATRP